MKIRTSILCAPAICAAAAALASCGGGTLTSENIPVRSAHASWMAPTAKKQVLLYISDYGDGAVHVFSWPKGKLVGTLSGFRRATGECVDKAGDVWITSYVSAEIVEYAHGGATPIATLSDPGEYPISCAVDPTTGNLAVGNIETTSDDQGSVAIYPGAQGTPTLYTDPGIDRIFFMDYDHKGNLFVDGRPNSTDGFVFAELPEGSGSFTNITLDQSIGMPAGVQWDGNDVVVGDQQAAYLYRFKLSGSSGTEVGVTPLDGSADVVQSCIQGRKVVGPNADSGNAMIWKYPAGGSATKTIDGLEIPFGAVISKPNRSVRQSRLSIANPRFAYLGW
jgi:hypothetical protein